MEDFDISKAKKNLFAKAFAEQNMNPNMGMMMPARPPLTFDLDYDNLGGVGVGTGLTTIETNENQIITITEFKLNFNSKKLTSAVDDYYNTCHIITDDSLIDSHYDVNSTISYNQRFGWLIGYRNYYYSGLTSYTSESVLDIIGPKYLFLVVNDLNNSSNVNFFSNSEETMLPDNILARFSM